MSQARPDADLWMATSHLPCGVLRVDRDGEILDLNDTLCRWLDQPRSSLLGQRFATILPSISPQFAEQLQWGGAVPEEETGLCYADGVMIPVRIRAWRPRQKSDDSIYFGLLDLRERQSLQIELEQAQQLEAIGRIVAGIAHEINTPVQFIGDSLYFLRESFDSLLRLGASYQELIATVESTDIARAQLEKVRAEEDEADLEFLREEIPGALARTTDGVGRVAEIARAVKEFCYPNQAEKTAVDLNSALTNALIVARNEYKHVADLNTDFGELPPVFCHLGHLNQVFLNLLINASHAIAAKNEPNDEKGTISIRTEHVGTDVVICIRDNGGGIPAEIQERIFDAFFTTKSRGHGSGQGLAIARSIVVDKHGGSIEFESEEGEGTAFFIRLPVNDGVEADSE